MEKKWKKWKTKFTRSLVVTIWRAAARSWRPFAAARPLRTNVHFSFVPIWVSLCLYPLIFSWQVRHPLDSKKLFVRHCPMYCPIHCLMYCSKYCLMMPLTRLEVVECLQVTLANFRYGQVDIGFQRDGVVCECPMAYAWFMRRICLRHPDARHFLPRKWVKEGRRQRAAKEVSLKREKLLRTRQEVYHPCSRFAFSKLDRTNHL